MSTVADFNRIDDCDKIDPNCLDAFHEFTYNEDEAPTTLCDKSSWGGGCIDLEPLVKAAESCTTLYLSPEEDPNCLVYEKEEKCGDNDCITGDSLSRIISLRLLKDTEQAELTNGDCYIYNAETDLFELYPLADTITNINTAIQNINQAITNLQNRMTSVENRVTAIEALLVPPTGTPSEASLTWGTINLYSDHNAAIDSSGNVTSLDKTHGLYTHNLNENVLDDEIMG